MNGSDFFDYNGSNLDFSIPGDGNLESFLKDLDQIMPVIDEAVVRVSLRQFFFNFEIFLKFLNISFSEYSQSECNLHSFYFRLWTPDEYFCHHCYRDDERLVEKIG